MASLPGTLPWNPARNLSGPPPPSVSLPALSGDLRPLRPLRLFSGFQAQTRVFCTDAKNKLRAETRTFVIWCGGWRANTALWLQLLELCILTFV